MATPRQSVYPTASGGGVYAGLPSSEWAGGTETGTFSSGLWTPARGASGRVTEASWNLVPNDAASWVEVAGTRIDSLQTDVATTVSGWYDLGGEDWNGVLHDWNGMAVDFRAGRERTIHAVSGGHYGSSNDGIYEFDLRKMKWGVELYPSDPAYWAGSYLPTGEGLTIYPPAKAYKEANPTNALGVFDDEFFDGAYPTDPVRSSRRPTSRHTYGSVVFVPGLGTAGKLFMGCRRLWIYDYGLKKWETPRIPFDTAPGSYDGATGYTSENTEAWVNEAEGRYYIACAQNYGSSFTWSVLFDGTGWRNEGTAFPVGGYAAFATAQEQIGTTLWTLDYFSGSLAYGKPLRMLETNLTTRAITTHTVTLGTSMSGLTFPGGSFDGQAMCWVPTLGKWLVMTASTELGPRWAWLDPTTWVLELATLANTPAAPGGDYRCQNKVRWVPGIGAVVWHINGDMNARLLKP